MAMLQLRLNWVLSRPANVSFHSHNTKAFKSMNLRMDQIPKNTSILIISRAIRISAVERFFRNSVECDSMWLCFRESPVKIDSLTSIRPTRKVPLWAKNSDSMTIDACQISYFYVHWVLGLFGHCSLEENSKWCGLHMSVWHYTWHHTTYNFPVKVLRESVHVWVCAYACMHAG